MADPTNPPLWQVMANASNDWNRLDKAAEIRAIAKCLSEAERRGEFVSSGLYGWLLAEADRAEAGE